MNKTWMHSTLGNKVQRAAAFGKTFYYFFKLHFLYVPSSPA